MPDNCPLCKSEAEVFYDDHKSRFYLCNNCKAVYRDPEQLPGLDHEKERYTLHQNSLEDQGYLRFLSPLIQTVKNMTAKNKSGLDFGCGHSPVISELLKKEGYQVDNFDPIFYPELEIVKDRYDFIICSEVIEHFHNPGVEFLKLYEALTAEGKLFCSTCLYSEQVDFASWYYKNDFTHVFFYQAETLEFIREKFGFSSVKIDGRVISFSKY